MRIFLLLVYRTVRGKDKNKLLRFSGQFTVSMDRARGGTDYKYVVLKKGIIHWEYLTEFRPRHYGGIVNRFLFIPDKYLKPGGKLFLVNTLEAGFTSDGFGVGVVIRSAERFDLVKTKFRFRLRIRRLQSSEN